MISIMVVDTVHITETIFFSYIKFMIKIIYCIKAGSQTEYSKHESLCIESWKKTYPDFTIKHVKDKDVWRLVQDCPYAKTYYERGSVVFAIDYVKLKLLYQYGGLYLDTDVMALQKIPDSYFQKTFVAFAAKHETNCTNSGTCIYAPHPHDPFIKECIDLYQGLDIPSNPNDFYDTSVIDVLFDKRGYHIPDHKLRSGLQDVDLGDVVLVNRIQFGVSDLVLNRISKDPRPKYLLHCHAGSWARKEAQNAVLLYGTLDYDTDLDTLYDFVEWFVGFTPIPGFQYFLALFENRVDGAEEDLAQRLLSEIPSGGSGRGFSKDWKILPLGDHLPHQDFQDSCQDFLIKRFGECKYQINIDGKKCLDQEQLFK